MEAEVGEWAQGWSHPVEDGSRAGKVPGGPGSAGQNPVEEAVGGWGQGLGGERLDR